MAVLNLQSSFKAIVLMTLALSAVLLMYVNKHKQDFFFFPSMKSKPVTEPTNANGTMTRNITSTNIWSTPLSEHNSSSSSQACQFINVDAFDPKIIKMAKKYPPLNCAKGRPWLVYIDGSYLKVNISKVKENPNAKNFSHCRYRTLTKGTNNDNTCIYGQWSKHFDKSISINDGAFFIETECYDKSKRDISNSYLFNVALYHKTHTKSLVSRYTNHSKKFAPKESLNVLLVGIDGMSKQNFERSLPKTRNFLLDNLNAIELKKYNKVGLNTFPNVMPLLTGHHWEFYTPAKWTRNKPFDRIGKYFVWKEFSKAGYLTALDMEEHYITAFHYMKKGFYKSPVDMYTRPTVLAMLKNKKLGSRLCKGDKPSASVHNDFLLEIATHFRKASSPYFAYSFLTILTHDDQNKVSSGDHLYLEFLQALHDRKALDNTILILFSDHGERFGNIRRTFNGIIESRSPGGFIVLPEWFKSKYPDEYQRLQVNAGRLTSVFDLHATLRDILYFKSTSPPPNLFPKPGISLFKEVIPESRMCRDAGVPATYCNCNALKVVKLDNKTSQYVSSAVTDTMMKALGGSKESNKCQTLSTKFIKSVYEKSIPQDRFKDIINRNSKLYEITIATTPGHGEYEAVVELNMKTNKTKVVGSISRLDMYKGEKECITDPFIRPFCFCK